MSDKYLPVKFEPKYRPVIDEIVKELETERGVDVPLPKMFMEALTFFKKHRRNPYLLQDNLTVTELEELL